MSPGRWLGPWAACLALQAAAASTQDPLGLHVAVLASAGGGAPWLQPEQFMHCFNAGGPSQGNPPKRGLLLLVPLVLGLGTVRCSLCL